jgi:hypothetical protein
MSFLKENQAIVAMHSIIVYYLLHFASFVLAVYLIPYLQPLSVQYVPEAYAWSRIVVVWLVAYLLALMILPELLCAIYKMIMLNDDPR